MGRRAKPPKGNAEAKRALGVQSPKNEDSAKVCDLEKRLAEGLEQLQTRDRELAEALEREAEAQARETATADILRVISHSPTVVEPVFEAIVTSGRHLCQAHQCLLVGFDGEMLTWLASDNFSPAREEALRSIFPYRPTRAGTTGRVVLDRAVVHIPDVLDDPDHAHKEVSIRAGARAQLAVPMFRENEVIGALHVARPEPGPFSQAQIDLLKRFADQAVIAIENVRLFNETKEALEQQTATAEILRVISTSPSDLQPVLDAMAKSAARLCAAQDVSIFRLVGDSLLLVAHDGPIPVPAAFTLPANRLNVPGRAVVERGNVHVADLQTEEGFTPEISRLARDSGFHTIVGVPLLREGAPIGAITLRRTELKLFSDRQIALLQTFADQAVIAIENVRLFTETKEALERQIATSEILRVISQSPTDVQPVFDTIVRSAVRLCDGLYSALHPFDGELIHLVAQHNFTPEALEAAHRIFPARPTRALLPGRAILERAVVHIPDVEIDPEPQSDQGLTRAVGWRSGLFVPMLREGAPIGVIVVARAQPGPFTDSEIALLQTFADQAVIAIENVRLFTQLQQKSEALTQAHAQVSEALDQQTATSEILGVISSSPTDVQPVFDTIVRNGMRLTGAARCVLFGFDRDMLSVLAMHNVRPEGIDIIHRMFPSPASRHSAMGRAVLDRTIVHIPDVTLDPEFGFPEAARAVDFRAVFSVPMIREGVAIGALVVSRSEPGAFMESQVQLLQTFADQAVIAIENVRLFTELQASNRELTTALDTQTATSDILRVISRSQMDVQPVFDAIVASAVRLLGAYSGLLTRVASDQIELAAHTSTDDAGDAVARAFYPQSLRSEGTHAQAIRGRAPVNIADAHTDPRLLEAQHAMARARGYRSQVVVPLLRHDEAIGAIAVTRREPGGFTDDEIALLKTFADQAVIAIENARLLTELQARTAELTRSVDELTALGDVSRALSSTLDLETVLQTIVTRAVQIAGTAGCNIWEYDEPRAEFRLRASHYADQGDIVLLQAPGRVTIIPRGQGVTSRVMERREPVQIADITIEGSYESPIRRPLIDAGHHALLGVPLLSEDEVIGVLAVTRKTPGEFEPETVRLLTTFATQSALAIQNARLFLEIEDKSRQLEAASQHKSEFLANMSHELRTPMNAILGFSEVLADGMFGEINDKQAEYLRDILESGRHLLSLINDILDLSKIEAGRMELEPTDFDLPSAIDNAMTLVRERAGRRGIALGRDIDERVGMIRGDERKVKQVLLNLLSNALKFTPEGGRIDVRATANTEMVEVSVADTGVGIAPEDQEAVFEEFRQVGTADKKVEGTGLGLALSRKFIELHGGRIWVKSHVGHGSTFTFTLPVRRNDRAVPLQ